MPEYPTTERRWRELVEREGWKFREVKAKGGKGGVRREFLPPESVAKLITKLTEARADGAEARQIMAVRAISKAEAATAEARRQQVTTDQLMSLLTEKGRVKLDAKYDVLMAWRDWYAEQLAQTPKLRKKAAYKHFSEAWNAGLVLATAEAKAKYPTLSTRTVERWVQDTTSMGVAKLADMRSSKTQGRPSAFDKNPMLARVFEGLITERPGIKSAHLHELINHARKDFESGEVLFEAVSYDAVLRHREKFETEHKQTLMALKNPDAWKNNYLSALGSASGDVLRLNQLWEMDGTPADWDLVGGRYTASAVIDVWGRRPKIRFSKTPRTETNKQLMRTAVLAWGVPEGVGTDRGSDYVNREFCLFLDEMGIQHHICAPFSPWQKPHVERFIKSYLHGIYEVLSQATGHSVAERSELEARQSFADQLFKKNAVVKVDMTVEELQRLTDAWIDGVYMRDFHDGLGMTPFERLSSNTAPVRRIENERALDILLAQPAGKRPIIAKKGVRFENAWFIHAELPLHIGKQADIRLDPNDMGRLYVRIDGQFLCIAECPERTGINRAEVAAHGRALQSKTISAAKAALKKSKKALPMSVDELVKDLVMTRAERSGKLARIERTAPHRSVGLDEAAKAAQADDAPKASSQYEQLMAESRAELEQHYSMQADMQATADHAARIGGANVVAHPAPSGFVSPVRNMTPEQRYDYWLGLYEKKKAGQALADAWQEDFFVSYPKSSAGRAQMAKRKNFDAV